jgi:hypothetical protein
MKILLKKHSNNFNKLIFKLEKPLNQLKNTKLNWKKTFHRLMYFVYNMKAQKHILWPSYCQ